MKKEVLLTREELAKSLRDLSSDIEKGEISLDQINEKIPLTLDVKYKFKNKNGYSKFKISFKWSSEHNSDKPFTFTPSKAKKISYKEAKTELASSLGDINEALSDNKFPTEKQVETVLFYCLAYTRSG